MKKIGTVLLAVLAAGTILGCSKKATDGGGASGAPVKITVEVYDRGTDGGKTNPNNNQWSKWIKEKILKDENIIVDFVPVNRGDEVTALINLMAAGTPPDVCYTYNGDGITQWGEQGGLFDVAPYINTTLKDLNEFLGPDLALPGRRMIERNKNNTTGAINSIPARRMNVARISTFIRKDWLDKLGLPLPTTTEEYYNALVAFKTQDPGNVGKNSVIPFALLGGRVDWTAGTILEAFIDPGLSDRDRWVNSAAERNFAVPGYREGLRFLNRMWNANLIDPDFSLYKDDSTWRNLIKSGVVGSFIQNWDEIYREPAGLLSDLRKNVPDADIVPVDCMTSSDGITHKISYDAAGVNFFIPKSAKNPEAAMRYLNWLAKYENYHFIQTGPEGIVHNIVDGIPKLIPSAGDGWIQNSAQNIDYTPMMNGMFLGTQEESIRAIAAGYDWPADVVAHAYSLAMTNARPGIVVSTNTPLIEAAPIANTLQDKGVVFFNDVIQAPADRFDSTYDARLKDWLASGAQKVIDERAAKYVAP